MAVGVNVRLLAFQMILELGKQTQQLALYDLDKLISSVEINENKKD